MNRILAMTVCELYPLENSCRMEGEMCALSHDLWLLQNILPLLY